MDERPLRQRRAVRVLVVDERERLLLFRDSDVLWGAQTYRWITPGGGIDDGESETVAVLRELAEETGLRVAAADLVGPLARRVVWHGFVNRVVRQEEVYVGLRVAPFEVDVRGHTDEERVSMTDHRWWTRQEVADTTEEVWPHSLLTLWQRLDDGAPEVTLPESEESAVPLVGPDGRWARRGPTG